MSNVSLVKEGGRLYSYTPYNKNFVSAAKALSGRWDPEEKAWHFDMREESEVRKLCMKVYGTDGSPVHVPTMSLKIQILRDIWGSSVTFGPFEAAKQFTRDGNPKIANNILILNGGFDGGGSVKYPAASPRIGTTLEIRDLPPALVQSIVDAEPEGEDPEWVILRDGQETRIDQDLERVVAAFLGLSDKQRGEFLKRVQAAPVEAVESEFSADKYFDEPSKKALISAPRQEEFDSVMAQIGMENELASPGGDDAFDENWQDLLGEAF